MSILVDVALDAGALASSLSLVAQEKIKAVLLTHSHLDHIMGLASLSMNAFLTGATVHVYATKVDGMRVRNEELAMYCQ